MPKVYAYTRAAGLEASLWYTLYDNAAEMTAYGLLTSDLTPKPAYQAFKIAAERLGGDYLGPVDVGTPQVEAYAFASSSGRTIVMWAQAGVVPVRLPLRPGVAKLYDLFGQLLTTLNAPTTVRLNARPVYLHLE